MEKNALGVLDGRVFFGEDNFVIWDCQTDGSGIFDGKYHFHDFYELSFLYDGEGRYGVNGSAFPAGRGFLLLTTPSDYHLLATNPGSRLCYYNVIFRENLLDKSLTDRLYHTAVPLCLTLSGEDYSSFLTDFTRLYRDYGTFARNPGGLAELLVKNGIEGICLRFLAALSAVEGERAYPEKSEDAVIRMALLFIRENYRSPLPLSRVAEAVGLSPGYFSSYFTRVMKIGFSEYLLRFRLTVAAGYVASSDLPLKAIASLNGFRSLNYFSSAFSAYFGLSPREYRRRNAARS